MKIRLVLAAEPTKTADNMSMQNFVDCWIANMMGVSLEVFDPNFEEVKLGEIEIQEFLVCKIEE